MKDYNDWVMANTKLFYIGLHVVEFDHNSAKVQWVQFTHLDLTQLIEYELKFDNNLYNSAAAEYVFSGLDSATEYTIEVRVVTKDYLHSVWSDSINFKTTPAKLLGNLAEPILRIPKLELLASRCKFVQPCFDHLI